MIKTCVDAIKKGRAAYQIGTRWETECIRVYYMDGSFEIRRRVGKIARQWSEITGIPFVPASNKEQSDIRVTFATGGSWSYVGAQAVDISKRDPTMQLGWLTEDTDDEEMQQVVLHEFGHAIGLLHEHQNPSGGINWDKDRVYAYYMGYPHHWSRHQVDVNVFDKYSQDITKFTEFDPLSIMLYPIPEEFTVDEYSVGWNLTISDTDKRFAAEMYGR